MTLDANGRAQNIKASIEKYATDNLVTSEGLTLALEGQPFESDDVTEWVQENILGIGGGYFGKTIKEDYSFLGTENGEVFTTEDDFWFVVEPYTSYTPVSALIVPILLNFNIFVDKTATTRINRHYELRDIVLNYFKVDSTIPLYDFYNNDFEYSIQEMKVRDIITDRVIPDVNYVQYTLTIDLEWTEMWT